MAWFSKKQESVSDGTKALRTQVREMFEKLENQSYRGEADDEDDFARLNQTITLAKSLLQLLNESEPAPLTRVYLATALRNRIEYFYQQVVALTSNSFYTVRKLAEIIRTGQPEAKKYLLNMVADLDYLLDDEMREEVAFRDQLLERQVMCYRALSEYGRAVDAAGNLLENNTDSQSHVLLAECYIDFSDYDNAEKIASKAIQCATNDLERFNGFNFRSRIYGEIGDQVAAERDRITAQSFGQVHKPL